MLEILAKRLAFFVQLIIAITLVCGIFWIQKIESLDLRDDLVSLNALEVLSEWEPLEVLSFENKYRQELSNGINTILSRQEFSNTSSNLEKVKQQIQDWLTMEFQSQDIEGEFLIAGLGSLNELIPPTSVPSSGNIRLLRDESNYVLVEFILSQHQSESLLQLEERKAYKNTVSNLLNRLDFFGAPLKMSVATSITGNFPSIPADLSNSYIKSITLLGEKVKITFEEDPSRSPAQRTPAMYEIEILVETQKIDVENLLSLISSNGDNTKVLEELYSENSRREFLDGAYGLLPLNEAKEVLSGNLVQAYQRVEILGFSISTKRLPLAVLMLFLVFLSGSFLTVIYAKRKSLRIISQVNDENPVDILIDNFFSRVLIFCVLPILSIVLSLPTFPISLLESILIKFGSLLVFSLGILIVINSRKL